VVSRPGVPSLYSRYALSRLAWDDYSGDTERLLDALVGFGTAQPEPPVLFYQEDGQILLISRHRERLAKAFRFVVADSDLVEDLQGALPDTGCATRTSSSDRPPLRSGEDRAGPSWASISTHPQAADQARSLERRSRIAQGALRRKSRDAARALAATERAWPRASGPRIRPWVRSQDRELSLLCRSARAHRRRVYRPQDPHLSLALRPHHRARDHRCRRCPRPRAPTSSSGSR
jgi:hypothetical protein